MKLAWIFAGSVVCSEWCIKVKAVVTDICVYKELHKFLELCNNSYSDSYWLPLVNFPFHNKVEMLIILQ